MTFVLDPRLQQDTHAVLVWNRCQLRLQRNASLPWFLIIPEAPVFEFHELDTQFHRDIRHLTQVLSDWIKADGQYTKINFAAIGNVVGQLHIHVIGRHPKDPLWPDVVWGQTLPERFYEAPDLERIRDQLERLLS